jgi:cyclopropane-fatty-acyl-phospholipid synthase
MHGRQSFEPLDPVTNIGVAGVPNAAARGRWTGRLALRLLRAGLTGWRHGALTVHLPDGSVERLGAPRATPHVTMWVHDERFFSDFLLRGDLGAGESYVRGDWRVDDLPGFIELAVRNAGAVGRDTLFTALANVPSTLGQWLRGNTRRGSRRNIHAHYDLSNDLFATFLDPTMAYSAAIFASPSDPLERAQRRKFDAFADKLAIGASDHVLEIGCGWGGFAMHVARTRGCRVTGVTISEEQFALATERVRAAGLSDRVEILLRDYRDVTGRFSRIVSIEMLEAVGREHWPAFFAKCDEVLALGGSIGLQVITVPDHRFEQYARTADWIQKYVFPGSLLGSISGFVEAMKRADTTLTIRGIEDIAPHYAETLRRWRATFFERLDEVRRLGFDDRFVRLWDFYLASCEAYFRTRTIADLQIVLGRAGEGADPFEATMRA